MTPTSTWQTNPWIRSARRKLLDWYAKHARDLPWRATRDPYAIWVSEIMLQQTQVATVIPYFARFLERFPSVSSLATADEGEVLRHWEGLGYYRRARQMHAAAKLIHFDDGGVFPNSFSAILALPGIGRYTAGAIMSFAFDQPYAIVEANTQRLYARLIGWKEDLKLPASQSILWEFGQRMVEGKECGRINQAMMELGATVCFPKNPQCHACPLQSLCPTFAQNLQSEIPKPKLAKIYEERRELVALLRDRQGRYLVRQCQPDERWAGLWDFPRFDVTHCQSPLDVESHIAVRCKETFGRPCQLGPRLHLLKHGVTRYRITLSCHTATWSRPGTIRSPHAPIQWHALDQLHTMAMSSTGRKICNLLSKAHR